MNKKEAIEFLETHLPNGPCIPHVKTIIEGLYAKGYMVVKRDN